MANDDHIIKSQLVEITGEINSIVLDRTIVPTAASTDVLTVASTAQYIFTGTTAGKVIRLPDATTLRNGLVYTFWNTSTVPITVKLNDGTTTRFTVAPAEEVTTTLQDNSTTNGIWVYARRGGGGTAAMPMHFGENGGVGNLYLFEATTSKLPSNTISPPFARRCAVVGYAFTCNPTFTVGKTIHIRESTSLTNKHSIPLLTAPQTEWNSAGLTTFNVGERPAIYLEKLANANLTDPRFIMYYVWID